MNEVVGTHDLLWIVLDSLRYDVARDALAAGQLPHISPWVERWEERHTPATFTWPAHHAFFSGFLPTPVRRPKAPRLFAADFPGSKTTSRNTYTFATPYLMEDLSQRGYHTLCIGGVSFFDPNNCLGKVFTQMFQESHWQKSFGPECAQSAERQLPFAAQRIAEAPAGPLFTFLNVAAVHPPNRMYHAAGTADSLESHCAALRYIDNNIAPLIAAVQQRPRPTFFIFCSDHGTAYGEEGYTGHRLAHPSVWTVPYAQGIINNIVPSLPRARGSYETLVPAHG